MQKSLTIKVPATTANLGPGFDCLGAALTLYNRFQFSLLEADRPCRITAQGPEAEKVQDNDQNLVYRSFARLYEHLGKTPPPIQIDIQLQVPLSRGLGSSATAIVGGLMGANEWAGRPLSQTEVMDLAIALEGHPDNVVPALIGGCRLSTSTPAGWQICDIPWQAEIIPVVVVPEFELSTQEARQVLPSQYSRADAIFNAAHLGLLLRALETGHPDWLKGALSDRIHQPYREPLIRGYAAVQTAALEAGAYGLVISGAGPTLLALSPVAQSEQVATAMSQAWLTQNISAQSHVLQIDPAGAQVE